MSHLPLTLANALAKGIVVAFDLEFTSWEGAVSRHWTGAGERREVVEIGAVKLDAAQSFRELAALRVLVRPLLNPLLSDYFTGLTRITQREVDQNGLSFSEALKAFATFVEAADAIVCWGSDAMVLAENCGIHRISFPISELKFHSVRSQVCEAFDLPYATASGELPDLLGLRRTGEKHDAISDARAVGDALALTISASKGRTKF